MNKFKYPIGKCKALHRNKEGKLYDLKDQPESELIGYSFFNIQEIDTEKNTVNPQDVAFEQRLNDFQKRVAAFNSEIAYWNSQGEAPEGE